MTFDNANVSELGLVLRLEPGELVQYDTFVARSVRGRGFQYPLNVPVLNYARDHGFRKNACAGACAQHSFIKNQVRSGKRVVQEGDCGEVTGQKATTGSSGFRQASLPPSCGIKNNSRGPPV